jgi:hypothetical protein
VLYRGGHLAVDVDIDILTARDLGELDNQSTGVMGCFQEGSYWVECASKDHVGAIGADVALIAGERTVLRDFGLEDIEVVDFGSVIFTIPWNEGGQGVGNGQIVQLHGVVRAVRNWAAERSSNKSKQCKEALHDEGRLNDCMS